MKLFNVYADFKEKSYSVYSVEAQKETEHYYWLPRSAPAAFGYHIRVDKDTFATSEREAIERFIRRKDMEHKAALGQAERASEALEWARTQLAQAEGAEASA